MVSANAEKSVKNLIIMGLLRKKSVKIDIKIIQNQIFKDFKYDFL